MSIQEAKGLALARLREQVAEGNLEAAKLSTSLVFSLEEAFESALATDVAVRPAGVAALKERVFEQLALVRSIFGGRIQDTELMDVAGLEA